MICRFILPLWAQQLNPKLPKVVEGDFSRKDIKRYNSLKYNAYYLPNYPSQYNKAKTITGADVDCFEYVFVDCDLKDGVYESKEQFIEVIASSGIEPTRIVDSGNGVHVFWKVTSLDAMSYLRFQRRLLRLLHTDEAVGQLFQLMRITDTINTKKEDNQVLCETLYESEVTYSAEELDKLLPAIKLEDEEYCKQHFDKTYNLNQQNLNISDEVPPKFGKLIKENHEVKELWTGNTDDRSKNDYRLGHIMFANGFTKEEAASVLINSAKALARAPNHRINYATNIIDKIWTYELEGEVESDLNLSDSVEDLIMRPKVSKTGTPFRCHKRIDNTVHGFRLGQVIGLVAGSGVGKTSFALNLFRWFAEQNPDFHHFFVPLEQPAGEIADRWVTMCQGDSSLHSKVHVISNYDDDGNFRHLSLEEIKQYIIKWKEKTGNKVGCIVIDHIGALKKKGSNNENQDLVTICHSMKAFAVATESIVVMQSQSNRDKAGIGDLELNKDAAYGTMFFEAYCDYLITLWQPLKRSHHEETCPTVTAFKFCKIRHKKAKKDIIKEDVPYYFSFDSETELMKDMTQTEIVQFDYWLPECTRQRNADRKTELLTYQSVPYKEGEESEPAKVKNNRQQARH